MPRATAIVNAKNYSCSTENKFPASASVPPECGVASIHTPFGLGTPMNGILTVTIWIWDGKSF